MLVEPDAEEAKVHHGVCNTVFHHHVTARHRRWPLLLSWLLVCGLLLVVRDTNNRSIVLHGDPREPAARVERSLRPVVTTPKYEAQRMPPTTQIKEVKEKFQSLLDRLGAIDHR